MDAGWKPALLRAWMDTIMTTTFRDVANNAAGTLANGVAAGDGSLVLDTGQGSEFPTAASRDFWVTVFEGSDTDTNEVMLVTARSSDTLTVMRAQQGTTARAWTAGANVQLMWTAQSAEDIHEAIGSLEDGATINKNWFADLLPGAGLEAISGGPGKTVYELNTYRRLIGIPFDSSTGENCAIQFRLPPDYDGSALQMDIQWTADTAGLSGDAEWRLYAPTGACAGDGDDLDQSGTDFLRLATDDYQGQWIQHRIAQTFTPTASAGDLFSGRFQRTLSGTQFGGDAILLGIRISYA